ncbi:transcription factor KUA1-like [Impatiens glandulifera]|uniref:transcription factor KUA1-like n=1 Tax=Impatiens glandulifera TaxID=253017 RepID=UPI001FB0C1DC|nr:transcription factor KUA1-like [Impatiens glandulifera]
MTRKCSYCNNNGHNSRTCPNRGVKIFGVRLTDGSIRKSASMGNLSHYNSNPNLNALVGGGGNHDLSGDYTPDHAVGNGYASEDFVAGSSSTSRERKKGVAWTEEEHRMFLLGLHKLGKGDWRGISKNYVVSRTPTQVASHAQKYFIRQTNVSKRKRRSSLFDIIPNDVGDNTTPIVPHDFFPDIVPKPDTIVPVQVSSPPTINEEVVESMDYTNTNQREPSYYQFLYPTFVPSFIPYPVPIWPAYGQEPETHQVVRPIAVHSKKPINVDEFVEISKLRIGESNEEEDDQSLSLNLFEGSSRQSAFHANSNPRKSNVDSSSNAIHAI